MKYVKSMAGIADSQPSSSSSLDNDVAEQAEMDVVPSSTEVNNRKRRLNDDEEPVDTSRQKRILLSEDLTAEFSEPTSEFNLLHFSDEVLIQIFLSCDEPTLRAISK